MEKKLKNKGVKYVTNKSCKVCNLLINGNAFYCVDCDNSVHSICTGLSQEAKIVFFVTNRVFSCTFCIKQKEKYNEALILLDKLEESENKERDLLNRAVQPQKPKSPLDLQKNDLHFKPPDVPTSTSEQRAIDQIVSLPDCIRAEDSMENDSFVDANEALMSSQNQEILENNSVLESMTYEADIQTQNSFTISTPLLPIGARVAYEKGIPDLKIDSVAFEEEEMSNGDQEVNYLRNHARQGQSQRSTNRRLPIPSPPQQQTTPPPPNFPPK